MIAKHPRLLMRIVALLSSGQSRVPGDRISDKNAKIAALTLSNLCQAQSTQQYILPFEKDLFLVAASDESVSGLLAPILSDL